MNVVEKSNHLRPTYLGGQEPGGKTRRGLVRRQIKQVQSVNRIYFSMSSGFNHSSVLLSVLSFPKLPFSGNRHLYTHKHWKSDEKENDKSTGTVLI